MWGFIINILSLIFIGLIKHWLFLLISLIVLFIVTLIVGTLDDSNQNGKASKYIGTLLIIIGILLIIIFHSLLWIIYSIGVLIWGGCLLNKGINTIDKEFMRLHDEFSKRFPS
jgi:hypothetical protein